LGGISLGKLDEVILTPFPNLLPSDFQSFCPNFIKKDTDEFAKEVNIPKMVPVMFYFMIAVYVEEFGVLPELVGDFLEEALKTLQ